MRHYSSFLPNKVSAIVWGLSNSGKTNVLFNLRFNPNEVKFSNAFIFSKSLYQLKYMFLENVLGNKNEIGYFHGQWKCHPSKWSKIEFYNNFWQNTLEKHSNISNFFSIWCHNNLFYLGQKYSRMMKQLVPVITSNFWCFSRRMISFMTHLQWSCEHWYSV